MRTLFLTSNTSNIKDEGKQKAFKNIYSFYKKEHKSIACSIKGQKIDEDHLIVKSNRFFLSFNFIKHIRIKDVSNIVYAPQSLLLWELYLE